MSIVAQVITTPITDAGKGANHQRVRGAIASAGSGSLIPFPVASVLKAATVGSAYSETISAQGGTSPYTFAVTAGALPGGLSMSTAGVISGTPSGTGTSSFTVTATDANSYAGSQSFSITTSAAPPAGGGSFVFVG